MKLSDWLKREDISGAEFARRASISEGMVSLLSRDETWLSREMAQKIFAATNGEVTPNDFLSLEQSESAQ